MRMSELLNEVRRFELDEGFSPREIKMAIGIASDPRYAKGNMTGAVTAIERMKKGLSKHPQVMAVLKRQNEDVDLDEAKMTTDITNDKKIFKDIEKMGVKVKNITPLSGNEKNSATITMVGTKNNINKVVDKYQMKHMMGVQDFDEEVELDEVFNGTKKDIRKITRATDNALRKRSTQIQKMLKSKTNEKGRGLTDFEFDHISDEGDAIAAELVYRKKRGKDPISDDIPSHLKKFVNEEVDLDEDFGPLFYALWGTGAMLVLPALMIYDVANRNSNYKLDAKVGEIVGKLLSKFKKDKNYKPNSAEIDASKKLEKEVKSKEPSIFNKAMSKLKSIKSKKEEVELDEKFSPKEIKMAIGIASDKRYAGGNMTGAMSAIEKIKKGLSKDPKVAAVIKRQNEDLDEKLDPVNKTAAKKKFDDRKDKDIDNDGDVDDSDEFLHKRRKAISKAMSKDEGNKFTGALNAAKEKGEKTFVVSGKTYKVEDYKKENYEFGTPERTKHTLEVTPGQSQEDWDETVGVMHKKNDTMREALAKMWSVDEGHNPFIKEADEFKPHMMYDPKTGKGFKATTMADHLRMKDMGYTHDAPKKENKTMTGKPTTKVTIEPEMKD